jgi:Ca2+-binding EF-hand superfamily protein
MGRFRLLLLRAGTFGSSTCVKDLERIFLKGDLNGDGRLDRFEFKALVHLLERPSDDADGRSGVEGLPRFSDEEVERLFTCLDTSKKGHLKFSTFFHSLKVSSMYLSELLEVIV